MLEIMNHARLGVGFESIGLCEAALRMARAYAAERRSMGKTIDQHEMIADYLDEMETDVVGLRALAMHAGFHEELGHKQQLFGRFTSAGQLDPERLAREAKAHRMAARRATPLLKYLAAEKAVEMARRCLQIHGGNGYMTRVRGREAAARRAGDADLRGHQPDPVADGHEGHAAGHHPGAAGVRQAGGPDALALAVGARSAGAAGGASCSCCRWRRSSTWSPALFAEKVKGASGPAAGQVAPGGLPAGVRQVEPEDATSAWPCCTPSA